MLTQIYEISSAEEAAAVCAIGIDHVGVLVGDGSFPREQSLQSAAAIAAVVRPPSRLSALFLSPDLHRIAGAALALGAPIVHLGAAPELPTPADMLELRRAVPGAHLMRSAATSR